jgi:5'-nucleotidase
VRILLTNDDGIHARGLRALHEALRAGGHDVTVVAPDREQSASSHSITLHRPLRIRSHELGWTVDGTPTDCVLVAVREVMASAPPDVVVSGINHGPNLGEVVTYSGTVAAAFDAQILGIPAIAASMKDREGGDYEGAAEFVNRIVVERDSWKCRGATILNVNFPEGPASGWKGARLTSLGTRTYSDEIIEKVDPRGQKYYWIGGQDPIWVGGEDTDFATVYGGGVSMTPLHLQLTDDHVREVLREWSLSWATS